jgi:hypothetical protein
VLDIGRVVVLLVALVVALRHRFVLGVIFGALVLGAFADVAALAAVGLAQQTVSGAYAIGLVFIGPTTVPYGDIEWLPCAVQWTLTAALAVPAFAALRRQLTVGDLSDEGARWRGVGGWFLFLFATSGCLAVTSTLMLFLVWHQMH